MPFTQTTHQDILDHVMMGTSMTQPSNLWVGLSTTTPTAAGGNVTEPSGNGYARVSTSGADWDPATLASPSVVTNGNQVTFPNPTGSWGTVTHFTIHSASTGGFVVAYGPLAQSKTINSGDPVNFPAGNLDVELGAPSDGFSGS